MPDSLLPALDTRDTGGAFCPLCRNTFQTYDSRVPVNGWVVHVSCLATPDAVARLVAITHPHIVPLLTSSDPVDQVVSLVFDGDNVLIAGTRQGHVYTLGPGVADWREHVPAVPGTLASFRELTSTIGDTGR